MNNINNFKKTSLFIFLFFFLSITMLGIAGCNDDDDGNKNTTAEETQNDDQAQTPGDSQGEDPLDGADDDVADNTPDNVTELCDTIDAQQDAAFIGCNVDVAIIRAINPGTTSLTAAEAVSVRYGRINTPFINEATDRNYLNVAIDFSGNEIFSDYTADSGTQPEWIVENATVIILPIDYNFYFPIIDSAINTGIDYKLKIVLSKTPVSDVAELDGTLGQNTSFIEGTTELTLFEFENFVNPDPDLNGSGEWQSIIQKDTPVSSASVAAPADTEIRDVDGVDILFIEGVPDLPQIYNTCVFSSITNSLAWLAKDNGFDLNIEYFDTTTAVDVNDINSIAENLFNPIYEFYDQEKATVTNPRTGLLAGVHTDNIVSVKNKFVEKNNIPVKTSQLAIDPQNPEDLIEQIKDRMEDGCMVEALWQLFDGNGNKIGGHVVNVTGYSLGPTYTGDGDIFDPSSTTDPNAYNKLVFHDANHTTPGTIGEVPQNDIYDFTVNDQNEIIIENYPFGPEGTAKVKMVGAIVECVDPEDEQILFDFSAMPDGELSIVHTVFISPCPQLIGTVTVTNTGNIAFDWFRMGIAGTRTTPTGGTLNPGESVTLTIEFTCELAKDISGDLIIQAMVGQETKQISIPVSVDVQESN